METGIYKIINLVNNKVYIGSAVDINERFGEHKNMLIKNKHHSIKLQRSFNKHGIHNFKFEIIEKCEPIKKTMFEQEQHYIDLYDSYNNGYNCTKKAGSSLGIKLSEETRIKISNSHLGQKCSDETKNKISKRHKGRKFSKEHKLKISKANKGKTLSVETKTKIGETQKILGLKKGKNNSAYNPTPIAQYDLQGNLIKKWKDRMEIRESVEFNIRQVVQACLNKIKTSGGYVWKFETAL